MTIMKVLKRKTIEIKIEFDSYVALLDSLSKIVSDAQKSNQYDGTTHNGCRYEWFQDYVKKEQPIHEFEIDGRIVQTFNSKLNRTELK